MDQRDSKKGEYIDFLYLSHDVDATQSVVVGIWLRGRDMEYGIRFSVKSDRRRFR